MGVQQAGRFSLLPGRDGQAARASELAPHELAELRRHVFNLTAGEFSQEGQFQTGPDDVEAIFGEYLPAWLREQAGGPPCQIVLLAHGGLVSEEDGLRAALRQLAWWKANRVYPLFFVWESGFGESLRQLLSGATRGGIPEELTGRRDLGDVADRVTETLVRRLGGGLIWGGIKRSAERAFEEQGAGRVILRTLQQFQRTLSDDVGVHAIGHSAGSIFWAHGLPTALDEGLRPIRTLHLLAPAITVELFKHTLLPRMGGVEGVSRGIDYVTLVTMSQPYERADSVTRLYRKSLLYLVHYALEPRRETPILGLESSIRRDPDASRVFGLGLHGPSSAGEVIWSVTSSTQGRSASRATTHADFDDDPATMHSLLRRIRNLDDEHPIVPLGDDMETNDVTWQSSAASVATPLLTGSASASAGSIVGRFDQQASGNGLRGRRRALCVGIDLYPEAPLAGCVGDAQRWRSWFEQQGFAVLPPLLDRHATRQAILECVGQLIAESRAGDVVAIQYSGHGTRLPDWNGDEADGGTPGLDGALVPVDHRLSGYIIDDDLAVLCDLIPARVNLTFFMDCCHSGANTRLLVESYNVARQRCLPPDAEMLAVHRATRRNRATALRSLSRNDDVQREILFSACRADQAAWESDGQGDFTRQALLALNAGIDGVTHATFQARILAGFGPRPRQEPQLWCDPRFRNAPLLTSMTTSDTRRPRHDAFMPRERADGRVCSSTYQSPTLPSV